MESYHWRAGVLQPRVSKEKQRGTHFRRSEGHRRAEFPLRCETSRCHFASSSTSLLQEVVIIAGGNKIKQILLLFPAQSPCLFRNFPCASVWLANKDICNLPDLGCKKMYFKRSRGKSSRFTWGLPRLEIPRSAYLQTHPTSLYAAQTHRSTPLPSFYHLASRFSPSAGRNYSFCPSVLNIT